MKSIIINQDIKECYVCGKKDNLHLHHTIFGKNRQKCDEDGLTVWLCYQHHEGTYGVHGKRGHKLDLELKKKAEIKYLKHYGKSTEDFIKRYGRSYI